MKYHSVPLSLLLLLGPAVAANTLTDDEQACVQAVIRASGNQDAIVQNINSDNNKTVVLVGVGEQREPWRCVISDGKVEDVKLSE